MFHVALHRGFFPRLLSLCFVLTAALGAASQAHAGLTVAVTASPDPVRPGDYINVEFTVANDGPGDLFAVTLESVMPENLYGLSEVQTDGGDCPGSACEPGETIVWTIGSLAAGQSTIRRMGPRVLTSSSTPPDGTSITFPVTALDSGAPQDTDSSSVITQSDPILDLGVVANVDPVAPGDSLTYVLTFGNRSGVSATPGMLLSLELPPELTFVSANGGGSLNGNTVEWSVGTLAPGAAGRRSATVTVSGAAADATSVKTQAYLTDASVPANMATDAEVITVNSAAPLPLQLTVLTDRDPVEPNESLFVDFVVTNQGNSDIFNVQVAGHYPDFINPTSTIWISDNGGCNNSSCSAGELITWDLGTVPAGATRVLTMRPVISTSTSAPPDGSVIPFRGRVGSSSLGWVSSGIDLIVDTDSLLNLEVNVDRDPVPAGSELTYTLTFGNRSNSSVTPGTAMSYRLPENVTFVSASDGGTQVGDLVVWSLGNLSPGQTGTRQLTVQVDAMASDGTQLVGVGIVRDSSSPTNIVRRRFSSVVETDATLLLEVNTAPGHIQPNTYFPIELTATNTGDSSLFNVVLEARVPKEVFDFSPALFTTRQATCSSTCNRDEYVSWNLGTLDPGQGASVLMSVRGQTDATSIDGSVADVFARIQDGLGETARAKRSFVMESDRKLELSVNAELDPVTPGSLQRYTLVYGNRDEFSVTPATHLHLTLPAGVSVVETSPGGNVSNGTVTWDLGNLSPGAAGQQEIVVEVDPGVEPGTILRADAHIGDGASPANENNASDLSRVIPAGQGLSVALDVLPDPVAKGETLGAEVTVSNDSMSDLFNVTLNLSLPNQIGATGTTFIGDGGNCGGSSCGPGEVATWTIGTLSAGTGVTRRIPMLVNTGTSGPTDGSVFHLTAQVSDGLGLNARTKRAAIADSAPNLALALAEQPDPIASTCRIDYELSVGNVASATVTPSTQLALALPPEAQFLMATGGGVYNNGAVTWPLGDLSPGTSGSARVTVRIPPAVAEGSLLKAEAVVIDGALPRDSARARAISHVETSGPLALRTMVSSRFADQGEQIEVKFNVTNTSSTQLSGVALNVPVPDHLNTIFSADIGGGGTCPGGSCTVREFINWPIGILAARSTFTGSFLATVRTSSPPPDGSLIRFVGFANDGLGHQANAAAMVRVGDESQVIEIDMHPVMLSTGVPDRNMNGGDEVLVLMKRPDDTLKAEMRDSKSGALLSGFEVLNATWSPVDIGVVEGFDANAGPELAVLARNGAGQLRIELRDLGTGALIDSRTVLNANWNPMELNVLDEISGGPAQELAVAAVNKTTGQILQHIRDAETDAFVRDVVFLGPAWTPLMTGVVPGYDPNPGQELSMLARNDTGKLVAMVRDAASKAFVNNVFHLGPAWTPRDFLVIPDLSTSANGVAELVVLATNDAGRLVLMIKDASTNGFLKNLFHLGPNWEPVKLVHFPDMNSSGDGELGVLAYNKCNGDTILQIRDAASPPPDFIRNLFTLTQDFRPTDVEVLTVDGLPAAATIGHNGVNGEVLAQVRNATNNQFIKNIKFFQ